MDSETLANHISRLSKKEFDELCKIVLEEIFLLHPVNVDGNNDGGADIRPISQSGRLEQVAYQISTQKTRIYEKLSNDVDKCINKLGIHSFYFLVSYPLSQVKKERYKNDIKRSHKISIEIYSPKELAEFIIDEPRAFIKILDRLQYPLPYNHNLETSYNEMALYAYTVYSSDSREIKTSIYDDEITFIISQKNGASEDEILREIETVLKLDSLNNTKKLRSRLSSLLSRKIIEQNDAKYFLSKEANEDIKNRFRIYAKELEDLSKEQSEILSVHFTWDKEDAKNAISYIANSYIIDQISILKSIKANIIAHPLFNIEDKGINKLVEYIVDKKHVSKNKAEELANELKDKASTHPLMTKIARTTIYLALENINPIASAKSLGVSRWSDFKIILDSSVALPYLCGILYEDCKKCNYDIIFKVIDELKKLETPLKIPYHYVNECASHLLNALNFTKLSPELFNDSDFVESSNVFVATYYRLKQDSKRLPNTLREFLLTFSPNLKIENADKKQWIRAIMTDIQELFVHDGIDFETFPYFSEDQQSPYYKIYAESLLKFNIEKQANLIRNDVFILFSISNDRSINRNHWIVLTRDTAMIDAGKNDLMNNWITTPRECLSLINTAKPLSECELVSLAHTIAPNASQRSLRIAAKIMDRIVALANDELQNWEFQKEIRTLKNNLISEACKESIENNSNINSKVDNFLLSRGIEMNKNIDLNSEE